MLLDFVKVEARGFEPFPAMLLLRCELTLRRRADECVMLGFWLDNARGARSLSQPISREDLLGILQRASQFAKILPYSILELSSISHCDYMR